MFALLGRFAYCHRWLVIAGWLGVLVAGVVFGSSVFDRLGSGADSYGDIESAEVERQLAEFGGVDTDVVVLLDGMAVSDPQLRSSVANLARELRAIPDVRAVTGPGSAGTEVSPDAGPGPEPDPATDPATGMVAADGTALLLAVELRPGLEPPDAKRVGDEITARVQDVDVPRALVGGPALLETEFQTASKQQPSGELIALPFIIVLLVFAFRGVLPALLPLLIAAVSVVGTLLVVLGVSYATTLSPYAVNVITMVGLGLAVDYALLLVSRFREERGAGHGVEEAATRMAATAGRTVAFSAVTVTVALTGLLVFAEPLLWSLAWGAIGVVMMTAAAVLTLVPALLRLFGRRIKPAPAKSNDYGVFYRLARVTQRFAPVLTPLLVAGLILLAAPVGHAEWGLSGPESLPTSSPTRQLTEVVQERFPAGASASITVTANTTPGSPTATALITWFEARPDVAAVRVRPQAPPGTTVFEILPSGPDQDVTAKQIVRDTHGLDFVTQVQVRAGGPAAVVVDFQDSISQRLPWAIAVICLATLVLLFFMTRSVVVAVKAIMMNVLSLTASFGALVWIFQDGHLSGLLGFDPIGSVDTTIPILIFVFAFGLSMDYEVFLLSRIKEHYDKTGDTDEAVAIGLQRSGRIVTLAAALMVVVFLGFVAGDMLMIKEFGLGMALTILIDATIVRTLLLPAVMKLMGRWNWWPSATPRAAPAPTIPARTAQTPRWPTESDLMAILTREERAVIKE